MSVLLYLYSLTGFGVTTIQKYDYESPIEIKYQGTKKEYGSSGGLMNTLAIYNTITKEDITKGKKIICTGTIDINGNVGKIDDDLRQNTNQPTDHKRLYKHKNNFPILRKHSFFTPPAQTKPRALCRECSPLAPTKPLIKARP